MGPRRASQRRPARRGERTARVVVVRAPRGAGPRPDRRHRRNGCAASGSPGSRQGRRDGIPATRGANRHASRCEPRGANTPGRLAREPLIRRSCARGHWRRRRPAILLMIGCRSFHPGGRVRHSLVTIFALAVLAAGCRPAEPVHEAGRDPVIGGAAAAPDSAKAPTSAHTDWPMPAGDYANTRYSTLDQIDTTTIRDLRVEWSFATGTLRGHEGQPLVVNNTMYVVTPWPNVAYAFDLTKEGYPLKWKYRPDVNPAAQGVACCDVVNRGPAYAGGRIIYNLLDAQTVALDAATGREIWR